MSKWQTRTPQKSHQRRYCCSFDGRESIFFDVGQTMSLFRRFPHTHQYYIESQSRHFLSPIYLSICDCDRIHGFSLGKPERWIWWFFAVNKTKWRRRDRKLRVTRSQGFSPPPPPSLSRLRSWGWGHCLSLSSGTQLALFCFCYCCMAHFLGHQCCAVPLHKSTMGALRFDLDLPVANLKEHPVNGTAEGGELAEDRARGRLSLWRTVPLSALPD